MTEILNKPLNDAVERLVAVMRVSKIRSITINDTGFPGSATEIKVSYERNLDEGETT